MKIAYHHRRKVTNWVTEIKNVLKWRSRNILIDPFYILRWDLLPRLNSIKRQTATRGDFASNIKVPITMVTYRRPWYFEKTLASFIEMNRPFIERLPIIVLVQDKDDAATKKIVDQYSSYIDNVIYSEINLGCAKGYNLLMVEAMKWMQPFIIHIQDDFISTEPVSKYMSDLITVMDENENLGCIRLRSVRDRVNDYNVISRRKIGYRKSNAWVRVGNGHFTFNPTISKSWVIRKIVPSLSEKDAQKKYQRLGLHTGQLWAQCFTHIGDERVDDWIK
jgi:hypothetical protein